MFWGPVFGAPYEVDGYLSPFFSPLIVADVLPWWFSPAILILWIPLGFRTTCYYYRKAYYRAYFADPPACAVGRAEVHGRYSMETAFPFILQNLHRVLPVPRVHPAVLPVARRGCSRSYHDGQWRLGPRERDPVRVNAALLAGYSLSCHSLRHLVGGKLDCFSCSRNAQVRYSLWRRLTG